MKPQQRHTITSSNNGFTLKTLVQSIRDKHQKPSADNRPNHPPYSPQHLKLERLEPRLLLSADLAIDIGQDLALENQVPGDRISVTLNLSNDGDASVSKPEVAVWASLDDTLDENDILLGSGKATGKLADGQDKTVKLKLNLPKDLIPGDYTLFAEADPNAKLTENDETNNVTNIGTLNNIWAFGEVDGHKGNVTLNVETEDGTEASFKLTGGGSGSVSYADGQFAIQLADTGNRSNLTVNIKDGDGSIGSITSATGLSSIKLINAPLQGDIQIGGNLAKLSLDDVLGGSVVIEGTSGKLNVTAKDIKDLSFDSATAIGKFTANEWLDTDDTADSLTAPSLAALKIKGDFQADLNLSQADAKGMTLGSATIGGDSSGEWLVLGKTGRLLLDSTSGSWHGTFTGEISLLKTKGDLAGTLDTPNVKNLQVGRNLNAAVLNIGANLGSDGALGGTGDAADSFGQAAIANFFVKGDVADSRIRIGMNPTNGSYDDGDDSLLSGTPFKKITVQGDLTGTTKVFAAAFPARVKIGGRNQSSADVDQFLTQAPGQEVLIDLSAALQNPGTNNVTNNIGVSGTVDTSGTGIQLKVRFDDATGYSDFSGKVGDGGSFQISHQELVALFPNQQIADGAHTIHFLATNAEGGTKSFDLSFTLDTVAQFASFGVSETDAVGGDTSKTAAANVVLRGSAEAGSQVSYGNQTVLVGNNGNFTLPGVALTLGDNSITLAITDPAGNVNQLTRTLTRVDQTQADPVLAWNDIALHAIQRDVTDPPIATRMLAMLSLAQYDTLAAIEGTQAYMVQRSLTGEVDAQAALATAAYRILTLSYPAQKATFDAALASDLTLIADGAAKDNGIALGLSIADAVWAIRENDGSDDYDTYIGSEEPGAWRPTAPAFDLPDEPHWGNVTPFALDSADEFRPAPPPALDSAAYAEAVNEIKALGSADSSTRTADQTEQALFWADGKGSFTPPGHWNQIASEVAFAQGNSLSANVRLFAQLNVALADAGIACWDAKYTYGLWRPITAIQDAEFDNNPATEDDDDWRPLLLTPPHPEYVSGHSTFSAAAATVLAATFGDDVAFSTTSATLPGVTRDYTSFSEASQEAGRSRVYGGIHYEFTNQAGNALGNQVANAVLTRFALTEDTQAPVVIVDNVAAYAKDNPTLTGQVVDNLSGVAGAQYRIDGGDWQTLNLDAEGKFSISTAFALDGSADGSHSVSIMATDASGNASGAYTRTFTLDTQAPTVTVTSLAEGDSLTANIRLKGSADGTGTTLTMLNYQFDTGTVRSLIYDSTGKFDDLLQYGDLSVGEHSLKITAQDSAGNQTVQTLTVKVDALAPFTITKISPADGSANVGVTQRPQINFSRAVNPATLTGKNLYATAPDGTKLATTIVPAADGSFAWLFFTNPMPGGSEITIHVDGSKIRAAADGSFLDADGDGTAGGETTVSFTTVSTTAITGTKLIGKVVDPGPDLEPMTFDDIRRGPDGVPHTADDVFKLPIAHAKVFILGHEDQFVYTDENGNFELTDVPAGEVKLAIDGRTATNAPDGVFFPEMVMALEIKAGVTNTVMGSMGSDEEKLANADRVEAYLPRIANTVLQDVSNSEPTTITTANADAAPNLTPEEREKLTLTINPGTAVGEDGTIVDNAQIGIATVPPELVRDMLPPGVLQHTFDITIQAPGIATFTDPVEITFPNVFNAAPGTKLNILSFDHTTGMLVINGTGTVSADGLTVVSDPGSGVRAPGWHGMTPPGGCGGAPTPPMPPHEPDPNDTSDPKEYITLPLITDEGGSFDFPDMSWTAPDPLPDTPPTPPDPSGCPQPAPDLPDEKQPYIQVTITVDGPLGDYMKQTGDVALTGDSFALRAGTGITKTFDMVAKTFAELSANGMKDFEKNVLFGSSITIEEVTGRPDGSTHTTTKEYLLTRYVDATDDNHTDGQTEFSKTINDGAAGIHRVAPIEFRTGSQKPELNISSGTHFFDASSSGELWFDPVSSGLLSASEELTDELEIKNPQNGDVAGTIDLKGVGADKQVWDIDVSSLESTLASIAGGSDGNVDYSFVSAAEIKLFDNLEDDGVTAKPNERSDLANDIATAMYGFYSGFTDGLVGGGTLLGDEIEIVFSTYSEGGVAKAGLYGTSSPAGGVDNVFDQSSGSSEDTVSTVINNMNNYSKAELAFRLDNSINPEYDGDVNVHPDTHFEYWDLAAQATPRATFIQMVAETAAHEFGHTLSLAHTYKTFAPNPSKQTGPGNTLDLMMGHAGDLPSSHGGNLSLKTQTSTALKMSLDLNYTAADAQVISNYYYQNIVVEGGFSTPAEDGGEEPETPNLVFQGPHLAVFDADAEMGIFGDMDFGNVAVGGTVQKNLLLINYGNEDLSIAGLTSAGGAFTLGNLAPNTVLHPGESVNVTLNFSPATIGSFTGTINLNSNAVNGLTKIDLAGFGQNAAATATAVYANNNFGGADLTTGQVTRSFTVRNDGQQDLVISGLSIANGASDFSLVNAPSDLDTNPITLAFGETYTFEVKFDPSATGLLRGTVNVATNDPANGTLKVNVVGTGYDKSYQYHWGNDYVAVEVDGTVLRTQSGNDGYFEFFLPSDKAYKITVFDPESGLVAHGSGTTPASGGGTDLASGLVFRPSTAIDTDGDGLPDDAEFAIGTNQNKTDTDKDSLDDFTEIEQGLDPLGGLAIPTGIVSSVGLQGSAEAVAMLGSTSGDSGLTALVATGNKGLAIIDASKFNSPQVLAELALDGNNTDVAVDAARNIAAVAGGSAGLHIVNIADPSNPVLSKTLAFVNPVTHVDIRDGVAFVTTGTDIATVDLNTGELINTLNLSALGGNTLADLAIDGNTLFSLDRNNVLRTIGIAGDELTPLDSLNVGLGGGKLFVGGGVAYIGRNDGFNGGFSTVNVSDPSNLSLLSGPDSTNLGGNAIVANGSGLAVSVGNPGGVFGNNALDVVNVADPTDTGNLVTRIDLPQTPKDVVLANGLAFVADGSGGLQIVNYVNFDTLGVAPTVSISVDGIDADPATDGIQVLEGHSIRILPTITDDVQVRNVELLVNGQVVANDIAFPFELFTQAPAIATGGDSFTVQIRASDTGGNEALSNLITVDVVPDTFAPNVTSVNVNEGEERYIVRAINVVFDEPIDTELLTSTGVTLIGAGTDGVLDTEDDVNIPVSIDSRAFGQRVSFLIAGILPPGPYRFTLPAAAISDLAGNGLADPIVRNFSIRTASDIVAASGVPDVPTAPAANPGQQFGISVPFDPSTAKADFTVIDAGGSQSTLSLKANRWDSATGVAYFVVPMNAVTADIVVYSQVGEVRTDFADGTFPLQIVPVISGFEINSVSSDGSSASVTLYGTGFVEGNNSEYRFGNGDSASVVQDLDPSSGPDVQQTYDNNLNQYVNSRVVLTVPLTDGAFGPITVKTGGGVSAAFTTSLDGIAATALSGTPADAGQASANPGQSITISGADLSATTDVLFSYTDYNGNPQMVKVSPATVSADGSSATVTVPYDANGIASLRLFGSDSRLSLQIVPVLQSYSYNGNLLLYGAGFVEGGSQFAVGGVTVDDTVVDDGVDVSYYYDYTRSTYINNGHAILDSADLPNHGFGSIVVTTAGGSSAGLPLNQLKVAAAGTNLGDLAIDAAGDLWVSDYTNPGHLLRLDPDNGAVLQTITLTNSFGTPYLYNHSGLQIVAAEMSLNGTNVPAGSLLVFNGYPNTDQVFAVNPADGSILASLSLSANHDLTGAVFDPASGNLFLTANNGNQIVEVSAADGSVVASFEPPYNIQSWSGLAIDPATGHLWLGAYNGGGELVEYAIGAGGTSLTEVGRYDAGGQGIDGGNRISGLSFAADGSLLAATTSGIVVKIDLGKDAATLAPTLTAIDALAAAGTPADAGQASANAGQIIELTGSNFGPGTQVLFPVRDSNGNVGLQAVVPQLINADGTRLQVLVPPTATSGDVRISNLGTRDLGFTSYTDSIYRQVTVSFTAGSDSAEVRFADGGLEDLSNESWGIDNVLVKQGGSTVFQDDFEGGADAAWSDPATSSAYQANFTEFSGRFNNASQTLNLSGLTAGQTYTLSFDLYVLDSWDGVNGPDVFDVSVDGVSVLHDSVSNYNLQVAQTLNSSDGIRLQIVPTLTGMDGRPNQENLFYLYGSGFMEGASTLTIGGIAIPDQYLNQSPLDIYSNNTALNAVSPLTLDGPIRITTEGGYAELAGPTFGNQPLAGFTGIQAQAASGLAADADSPAANTGQTIVLTGQGFTYNTLVQFQGIDDSGQAGLITRTGTPNGDGTQLTIQVPALAVTGPVTVLGSNASFELQVVPTLRSVGGTIAAGNTLVIEASGLNADDLIINIDGRPVGDFSVRTLYDGTYSYYNDQQLLTLTVPNGITAGVITVGTGGGIASLRLGANITVLDPLSPADDVGGTLDTALTLNVGSNQSRQVNGNIGGTLAGFDVDMYRIDVNGGDVLSFDLSNSNDDYHILRIFDADGNQLDINYFYSNTTEQMHWTAPAGGSYFVGISGAYNSSYDPNVSGSGESSFYTGDYALNIERLAVDSSRLTGITATAASGTPAQAGVASANTGQTVTLTGSGLTSEDQIVFTSIDSSGNLYSNTVDPASVAEDGSSLTVIVPSDATTGSVRLERDSSGVLLQIVPSLEDVSMFPNADFIGGTLNISGSGFTESSTTINIGDQVIVDYSRSYSPYVSNTSLSLTVPDGAATGPIQIVTAGGSSAIFDLSLTGISATAASGTAGGSGASATSGQTVTLTGSGFKNSTSVVMSVVDPSGTAKDIIVRPSLVNAEGTEMQVIVPLNAISGVVRVLGDKTATALELQIVPTITGMDVNSVAADGSSANITLYGTGFVEGNNSEYRFGASGLVLLDAGANTGPDVQQTYDNNLNQYVNSRVVLTVPLTDGAFGPITVKTGGGVSAAFTTSLDGIAATALSGTPADAGQASANPGQSITISGADLSATTDVLFSYTDYNGNPQMVKVSPATVSADGSSATVTVPYDANGIASLRLFGSDSRLSLQIVPVLQSYSYNGNLLLYGAGFVEGGSQFAVGGVTVDDTVVDDGVDVSYYYDYTRSTYINNGHAILDSADLPNHGFGSIVVTTAGGSSAGLPLNQLKVAAAGTNLGDLAIDAAGDLWVSDYTNPGHLLRLDPDNGAVLQTITLTNSFGTPYLYNHSGLQIVAAEMSLNGTNVPAGSLLVFNGYPNTDQVFAVNPADGSILASLSLSANHDLTGAVFDPASGNLFLTANNGNQIVEVSAADGSVVASFEPPYNIQSWSGLAIDPATGHLWLGAYNGGGELVEYAIGAGGTSLTEVGRYDAGGQGIDGGNRISGLSFAADGSLLAATTSGIVVKIDLGKDAATLAPTLTAIDALAAAGTPADAGQASANAGQIIELTGSNFGPGTQVLFPVRDSNGNVGLQAVVPQLINADGTRLQVLVPPTATSGDVRISNLGTRDLGFTSYTDSIYRQVTVSFTAGSDSAEVRFADGGLEDLSNESWGIDNVLVKQGGSTVFQDDFEGGADAAWSDPATSSAYQANFTEFSGRFNNASQTLNLSGLTAGQTYTLSFDLYVLDSWDGVNGPDVFDVSVDGVSVLHDSVSNYNLQVAQTLNSSDGIRLQIVPTLTGMDGRPNQENLFYLYGSGFMEGASTLTIGGIAIPDQYLNQSPLDIYSNNTALNAVSPLTLDGPIRITTEGGYAELAGPTFGNQPLAGFTGIQAQAASGLAADADSPAANTGQTIVLTGQGFTYNTLVQFQGIDDSGQAGLITRTGTPNGDGTQLTIQVPALAVTGPVTVLGSNASFELQVVPTLRSVGGTIAAGNTLVIEASGLNADDVVFTIDGIAATVVDIRTLRDGSGSSKDQQLVTLTVPDGVSAGVIGVSTGGGSAGLTTGASVTALDNLAPADDVAGTLADALALTIGNNQSQEVSASIGGTLAGFDVDMFKLDVNGGDVLTLNVDTGDSYHLLRLFDADGNQLSSRYFFAGDSSELQYTVPYTGSLYLGVSGYYNANYDPTVSGSGTSSSLVGDYTLSVERLAGSTTRLSGITATAASGTPAQAGVASANTGQTVTLTGSGLTGDDDVVFTTVDSSGNLREQTVSPTSVAEDGNSLQVVVPSTAISGQVRLARENVGILLQIVPTLNDFSMSAGNGFIGNNLTITGSGYMDGATTVSIGGVDIRDYSSSYLPYVDSASLTIPVPDGAAGGPIQITTAGGTSAAFGPSFTGITATADSGSAAGEGASANPGQTISLTGSGFDATTDIVFQVVDQSGNLSDVVVKPTSVNEDGSEIQVQVPWNVVTGTVHIVGDQNGAALLLQIVPAVTGVEVIGINGSSMQIYLYGSGFVEGANNAYRFGADADSTVIYDPGTGTGPDVQLIYNATLNQYVNGRVYMTVPITAGTFGPIGVVSAGGSSAAFNVDLAGISGTAASGTPADAGKASANPGQSFTLSGSGFTGTSDVLLTYTDYDGNEKTVRIRPDSVADGAGSASFTAPLDANGVVKVRMLGSDTTLELQIVPLLDSFDYNGSLLLYGAGFVEGGTQYAVGGVTVDDTATGDGVDVSYYYDNNRSTYVYNGYAVLDTADLDHNGFGSVAVTTAGGTSAGLALNLLKVTVAGTNLGDVAVNAAGELWVSDYSNPGHLLRIDPANGDTLQTITLTDAFGTPYLYNHAGLEVLTSDISLGGTNVPSGSLLVFNGYPNTDKVFAVDPADGSILATLTLSANHDLTGAVYDPGTGNLFLTANNGNQIVEVSAADGSVVASFSAPYNVQSWSGLAIDPNTGHLWLGAYNGVSTLVEYSIDDAGATLTEVSQFDAASQGIDSNNRVSGLAFQADGTLLASTTQGAVVSLTLA
ncbi:choice-of-anchor D domain-containing protein [Methylomonas sp. HYX-M1]|uniref:choice-of-anchor D domain-containing protein n=1 Tax=Methylomonas sp. HYX-M1 TaxID=3139307 RepID=UPI00345BB53A